MSSDISPISGVSSSDYTQYGTGSLFAILQQLQLQSTLDEDEGEQSTNLPSLLATALNALPSSSQNTAQTTTSMNALIAALGSDPEAASQLAQILVQNPALIGSLFGQLSATQSSDLLSILQQANPSAGDEVAQEVTSLDPSLATQEEHPAHQSAYAAYEQGDSISRGVPNVSVPILPAEVVF